MRTSELVEKIREQVEREKENTGKENAEEKVTLHLNGVEINSIQQLRQEIARKFDEEIIREMLDQHLLYKWLKQHYYVMEAETVKHLTSESSGWLKRLTDALKIPYNPIGNEVYEKDDNYNERLKMVKEAAGNDVENVPSNVYLVALNQEELAALLDAKLKMIYLCKGEFSIPLSCTGIHYIGLNHPTIDSPFTRGQYNKAGIIVENIDLPEQVDEETSRYAEKMAEENGYDSFYDTHCDLANAVHDRLRKLIYFKYYFVPCNYEFGEKEYHSEYEAKKAVKRIVRQAYEVGSNLFDTGSDTCVVSETATYYADYLAEEYQSIREMLKVFCEKKQKMHLYNQMEELCRGSREYLVKKLEQELRESQEYYSLYHMDYFVDQVDIEEFDSSIETDPFLSILESIFTNPVTYNISDVCCTVNEIENDVNDRAQTFQKAAKTCYQELEAKIEDVMEQIGNGLPAMQDGERICEYLQRVAGVSTDL